MVVKSDGTKWACLSCLKGHRVSGCTHTDRDLILVPKKGRPVTQCQHCRQERKKRSAHVKCDCGEVDKPHHPKEKCIHLREAEERLKAGSHEDPSAREDPVHLAAVADEQGCCCHHGGKCTCSLLKKESRDSSDDALTPHGPAVKPRLDSRASDGHITVFQNGHHKPVHRKNHAAHECGMPYKMPMPRTQSQQDIPSAVRSSVDNLALDHGLHRPGLERRVSKSEQHSPKTGPADLDQKMSEYDFNSLTQVSTNQSQQSLASDAYSFPPFEPLSATAESSYDPWSGLPNNNPFGAWPTVDGTGMVQPALTATSSGTQSEIDEVPALDDMYSFGMPSIQEDPSAFNFNAAPTGESPQTNRRSLPPNFFSQSDLMTLNGQWESGMDITRDDALKSKPVDGAPSPAFNDMWSTSMVPSSSVASRATGLTINGRPASHSVGPGSAPNDELMQQLFPGIDVNSNLFSTDSPQDTATTKTYAIEPTSTPLNFGPLDGGDAMFTTQPWADGSMSVPNDPFNAPYDLDEEFSNPQFTNGWTQ